MSKQQEQEIKAIEQDLANCCANVDAQDCLNEDGLDIRSDECQKCFAKSLHSIGYVNINNIKLTDKRTQYVLGFLFRVNLKVGYEVALIKKTHPEWQKGRWNGIGGHIEQGETPAQAMKREFIEEAGVSIDNWEQYCTVYYTDAVIHFFRAFMDANIKTKTDEEVFWQPLSNLTVNVIANLNWLIPMALYNDTDMQNITWTPQLAHNLKELGR